MHYRQITASAILSLLVLPLGAQELPVPNPSASPASSVQPIAFPTTPEVPAPIEPPVAQPGMATEVLMTPGSAKPGPISPPLTTPSAEGVVPMPGAPAAGLIPPSAVNTGTAVPVGANPNFAEFSDDDLTQVIRLLARQAKISLFISDRIVGQQPPMKVSVRLENKAPLDALRIIVDSKGLILDAKEDVYYVKTKEEKDAEPQVPGMYTFSYASAEKMLPLLGTQLVSRAPVQFDARTNTVFYREVKSNKDNIDLFLKSVDMPTQQVMIEARLVEVNASPRQSYGINWGGVFGSSGSPKTFNFAGSVPQALAAVSGTTGGGVVLAPPSVTNGKLNPTDFFGLPKGGNPLSGVFSQFPGQTAILSAPAMSLTVRLLNEDTDAEFLANPRIVTANNQEAVIKITRNQPVPQLNFNEQTATAVFGGFTDKSFGNTLKVLPIINKDNFITLRVDPEISNKVGDSVFNFAGAEVTSPIIDTRVLSSQVLIKSGDTLAIGGLLQDEVTKSKTKVPVLGDIPIIGYAFQEKLNARTKRNLLIFVTPTVVNQEYGTGLENQVSGLHDSGEEYADPNGWRNNAKGALRIVPTSNRALGADYPKPGAPAAPVKYKSSIPHREQ